jgi:hypothetical protein
MKKINTFIVLLISFLLSGCASIDTQVMAMGPYKENYLEKIISESIPSKNEKIILLNPGYLQFDKKGMKDMRPIVSNVIATSIPGVLVLTDKNVLLQQWDKEKLIYKNAWQISFEEINSISLESFGISKNISAHLKNDRYVTFWFGAITNDAEVALKAHDLMPENLKNPKQIKP